MGRADFRGLLQKPVPAVFFWHSSIQMQFAFTKHIWIILDQSSSAVLSQLRFPSPGDAIPQVKRIPGTQTKSFCVTNFVRSQFDAFRFFFDGSKNQKHSCHIPAPQNRYSGRKNLRTPQAQAEVVKLVNTVVSKTTGRNPLSVRFRPSVHFTPVF